MIMDKIKTLDQAKTQLENLVLTLRHDGYSNDVDALSLALDALNTAADKDRQIAILVEALEHYAKKINWVCQNPATLHRCGHRYECEMSGFDIEDKEQGWDVATKALAAAKSIQEGEISVCAHVRNSGYKTDYCSKCGEYIRGEFCAVCYHSKPNHFEPDTTIPVYCCDGCDGFVESKRIQEGE